LIINKEVSR